MIGAADGSSVIKTKQLFSTLPYPLPEKDEFFEFHVKHRCRRFDPSRTFNEKITILTEACSGRLKGLNVSGHPAAT